MEKQIVEITFGGFHQCLTPSLAPFTVLFRCYGRALKLMPEAPSLWYDLGLNYHRQASLPCLADGDSSIQPLLLEKAQQVPALPLSLYMKSSISTRFRYGPLC